MRLFPDRSAPAARVALQASVDGARPPARAFPVRSLTLLLLLLLPGCTYIETLLPRRSAPPPQPEPAVVVPAELSPEDARVEVLWDTWGVPHIFAKDAAAVFYAFGWAQARSHGDLLLRLYGQARGRAAEYWGEEFVDSDRWMLVNDVPSRAELWLAAQSPHMRAYLESFVSGINTFAEQNPDAIGEQWRAVLPVRPADVLAHQQRVLQFTFMSGPGMVARAGAGWQPGGGSNAWAIAPARSTTGNALLLANPHLPWGDLFTFYEAHLVAPGLDAYGAALVGFPLPSIAFNRHLGWTHTVNTLDGADLYELRLSGDGYVYDGAVRAFETSRATLRVRQEDGTVAEQPFVIRSSVHGPVVMQRDSFALALRVAGLGAAGLAEQYWDMLRATDIAQFEATLSRLQLPMFSVIYADRAGNILHLFNGTVPVRQTGDWSYWQGIVPGDTSATLWTQAHQYFTLPRVHNPASGWLQNANDPPWTTTIPFPIDPAFYPPYMAPQVPMSFRPQRSARMLAETPRMSLDRMVELKHSTRMQAADHLVQDVVAAARAVGDPDARAAADVLEAWDRSADADSRGAVLFQAFFRNLMRQRWPDGSPFEVQWTPRAPLATPDGLADPRLAVGVLSRTAQEVRATFGALDVPWGDVHRLRRDTLDLPANGGPGGVGIFRVVDFERADSVTLVASSGDSWVAAIEFSEPVRARALLTYGNASQPGSPHRVDQLPLFAQKRLREVWLTRDEVMSNLSLREAF